MRLLIERDFECFSPIDVELADFSIITGINGVGKTRLLETLRTQLLHQTPGVNPPYYNTSPIKVFGSSTLLKKYGLEKLVLEKIAYFELGNIEPKLELESTGLSQHTGNERVAINPIHHIYRDYQSLTGDGFRRELPAPVGFLKIANKLGKGVFELTREDIYDNYKLEDGYPNKNFFSERAGALVGHYAQIKLDNTLNGFENVHEGKSNLYYTEEEFVEKYGKDPIILFNEVFRSCNLPYELTVEKVNRGIYHNVILRNSVTGAKVDQLQLSSGEKLILAFALAVYNAQRGNIERTDLVLLDEPDASLHPAMVKDLLDSIQRVFIDNEIKVIMTTHSPSTIALAPESATIYLLEKNPTKLTTLSKDNAISKLTAGIPTLSVRIENRRTVFVESNNDVASLEAFFYKLKPELKTEYSLVFTTTEKNGQSNCGKVIHILDTLKDIPAVYGVVDYDGVNRPNGNLVVLGQCHRDGMENYVFDPVVLGIYLIIETWLTQEEVGLSETEPYWLVKDFENDRLQQFSDKVIDALFAFEDVLKEKAKTEAILSKYVNGREISIPKWYATTDDHALKNFVISRFPKLKEKNKHEKLADDVLSKTIFNMPGLIPMDILDTMRILVS